MDAFDHLIIAFAAVCPGLLVFALMHAPIADPFPAALTMGSSR